MSVEESIKRTLYPNSVFKVYMFHKDRRVSTHLVLPQNGKFKLKGNGYIINPHRIFMQKNIPCAVYSSAIAEPINPLDINEKSQLSAQDFYNAIDSTVVQDIIRNTNKADNTMLAAIVFIGLVSILGMGFLAYYLGGMIEAQNAVINSLKAAIDTIPSIPGGSGW